MVHHNAPGILIKEDGFLLTYKTDEPDRLINYSQLELLVGLSKSQVGRLEKCGKFPQRIRLGERRVGWSLNEIHNWIDEQKKQRVNI